MMFKRMIALFALLGWLALAPQAALANPGQEQAFAGRVAEIKDIPMSEVRVTDVENSRSGIETVELHHPGGAATC